MGAMILSLSFVIWISLADSTRYSRGRDQLPYTIPGCQVQSYGAINYLEKVLLEPERSTLGRLVLRSLGTRGIDSVTKWFHPDSSGELWHAWCRNKVHNWTAEETILWLINYAKLPEYERLFHQAKISGSSIPRLLEPGFINSYDLDYMGSSFSMLMERVVDIILFGPPEKDPSVYLLLAILVLLIVFLTCLVTVCLTRDFCKPEKITLEYEGLAESKEILHVLQKNVSNQIDACKSNTDNCIALHHGNGDSDKISEDVCDTNHYKLNWNEFSETVIHSGRSILFSAAKFSVFVSLLRESYISEAKCLLKEIKNIAQKLSAVEDLYFESRSNNCLLGFSHRNEECANEEICHMNEVIVEVSNLKFEAEKRNKRWSSIFASIRRAYMESGQCNGDNRYATTGNSALGTIHKLINSGVDREKIEPLKNVAVIGSDKSHKLLDKPDEHFSLIGIKRDPSDGSKSLNGTQVTSDNVENHMHLSDNGFDSSSCILHKDDTRDHSYSNLHSTKIPTFIHLSRSSEKSSGNSQGKCRGSSKSGSVLPSSSLIQTHSDTSNHTPLTVQITDSDSSYIVSTGKLRIPFSDFTNTSVTQIKHSGLRKPKPVKT
ncbi:unnamed protein product [Heterobilharzia americana]|nr:unnamed protein product [Heterobilharzia americana]CAH8554529.1 unnamed protein product [Heterobilharzia americana]